jgi:hypothetical protein
MEKRVEATVMDSVEVAQLNTAIRFGSPILAWIQAVVADDGIAALR